MRKLTLFAVLLAAACGDGQDVLEPQAADLQNNPPTTATIAIQGVVWEYGCPDFPCPVLPIVQQHINAGHWFWMPQSQTSRPSIYLPALRVVVPLRTHKETPIIDPPIINPPPTPALSGPAKITGRILPPVDQVVCSGFKLNLTNGSQWQFSTGTITYQYVEFNPATQQWEPTGLTSVVPFGASAWAAMLNGSYGLYPPFGNMEYNAIITANLVSGTFKATVDHTFLCHLPPPPAPPAPTLDGPDHVFGGMNWPNVQCPVQLTLDSPDQGPWTFVSGRETIHFLKWDFQLDNHVRTGQNVSKDLSGSDWDQLLNGGYLAVPGVVIPAHEIVYEITVARGPYTFDLTHTLKCTADGGPGAAD